MGNSSSCKSETYQDPHSPMFSFLKKAGSHVEPSKGFGLLKLELDKPYYFPGDYLRGLAVIELNSNFPGRFLFLRIKGTEKFIWDETVNKSEMTTEEKG
jgi:hypothetical protein